LSRLIELTCNLGYMMASFGNSQSEPDSGNCFHREARDIRLHGGSELERSKAFHSVLSQRK
jgi:hypothetical protein